MGNDGKKNSGSTTTKELFLKAQKKGPQAVGDLVQRIHERLFRFCIYLTGNVDEARDLSQEVYVKVLENIDTLQNPDHFVSWLFTVTRNHFLDYVKSPRNHAKKPIYELENVLQVAGSSKDWVSNLCRELNRLSPEDRYLLLLVCLEGHTHREAAALVGSTEDAVKVKVFRLKKAFDRKDFFTGDVPTEKPRKAG